MSIALHNEDSEVVGVDIMPDVNLCKIYAKEQLGLQDLPPNLYLEQVRPGSLHNDRDLFDLIYSWSVFEHVNQGLLLPTFSKLKCALKPHGLLYIQIAPLFYSEDGGHLMYRVPEPWGHLVNQHSVYMEKVRAACASEDEFSRNRSMYETLNRLTADELVANAEEAGFEVLRQHRTDRRSEIPKSIAKVYAHEVLWNEQVVLLLRARRQAPTHSEAISR